MENCGGFALCNGSCPDSPGAGLLSLAVVIRILPRPCAHSVLAVRQVSGPTCCVTWGPPMATRPTRWIASLRCSVVGCLWLHQYGNVCTAIWIYAEQWAWLSVM